MKQHSLLILLVIVCALIPVFYLNQWLVKVLKPRLSPARFFLFFFVNFLLIIVYTVLVVGLVVRIFPH